VISNAAVESHGLNLWVLHMLRRAEPPEAYPTKLLMSFEGYPLAFIYGLLKGWLDA